MTSRVGRVAGWLVLAGSVLVLLDVWLGPARTSLVLLNALAPWLLFAAWVVAVVALGLRRWRLGVAALVIVALHLVVVLPSFAPWHSPPRAAAGTAFTVYDQNVRYDNADLTEVGRQITAARPDVVTLEEVSRRNWPTLEPALAGYPYREVVLDRGSRGFAILSRFPLSGAGPWRAAGVSMLQATVAAPGGAVHLLVVHTISPTSGSDTADWDRELPAIGARMRATPQPWVAIGDYNATQAMPQLRRLLTHGVSDAADSAGEGWRLTWPTHGHLPFRVFRLHHALLSPGLTVTAYAVDATHDGSDHAALHLTLARRG